MKTAIRNTFRYSAITLATLGGAASIVASGPMTAAFAATETTGAQTAQAPDATFIIYDERNAGPGTFAGGGTLNYQGQEHAFTIQGMNVQGTSTNHPVEGAIYNLKRIDDLAGHYTLVTHERRNGVDVVRLRNEKGVEAVARGTNDGMVLGLKASGLTVTAQN